MLQMIPGITIKEVFSAFQPAYAGISALLSSLHKSQ